MEYYDYFEEMKKDILQYIADNDINLSEVEEGRLEDELWGDDSITGNGGFYYDTEEKCRQYLAGNTDLLIEAADELGVEVRTILLERERIHRYCDCIIRLYLLYGVIDNIYTEYQEAHEDD